MAARRRVTMVLEEGTKDGIMSVTDSKWNAGKLYIAPRGKLNEVLEMDDSKNFGVYLLLSDDKVYVGKASELRKRVKQHQVTKDWWTKVVMLTTTNNSLDANQITFLESELIRISSERNTFESENGKGGDKYNPNAENIIDAEDYLEQALEVLDFIGIKVFVKEEEKNEVPINIVGNMNHSLDRKKDVKDYLAENGIDWTDYSYSVLNDSGAFNIDAQIDLLKKDWKVVLNNTEIKTIFVLLIPKKVLDKYGIDNFRNKNKNDKSDRRKSIRISPESFLLSKKRESQKERLCIKDYIVKEIKYQ